MHARHLLLELYDAALRRVAGDVCVESALRDLGPRPVALFAIGKAASSMIRGAYAALGANVRQALLITKDGHVDPDVSGLPNLQIIESAHPVPDERSLAAGAAIEARLAALAAELYPVFLVSGGSSSLAELPAPGVSLADLRGLNQRGLAAGWDIGRLNAERGRLSRLKNGGVARMLAGRPALALFLSDVPDDDVSVIGSGLLGQEPGRVDRVTRRVVANMDMAVRTVADAAQARGLDLEVRRQRFGGEAVDVAREFVDVLRHTHAQALVWGGESTVTLNGVVGRGGRNTHLALVAARCLRRDEGLVILAAGTDGTDGPTEDAGAMVDAGTVERAELAGLDVERGLAMFDSGAVLEASGDLVHTGPTGTNVGDLLIGIRQNATWRRDAARVHMI